MSGMFRDLSPSEEEEFRQYARDNDPENMEHWEIYHPVCRDEWTKRGIKPAADHEEKSTRQLLEG